MKISLLSIKVVVLLLIGTLNLYAAKETYVIDTAHSSVSFKIRHFFSKVTGNFGKFEGSLIVDQEHMDESSTQAVIDVNSIDTQQEKRDAHLKNADFFDTDQYPKITFKSKKWKTLGSDEYEVIGDLEIRGTTKEITLKVKSLGFGEGMNQAQISGWEATTLLKKSDFGITYGGKALGEDVEVEIQIEARKQ